MSLFCFVYMHFKKDRWCSLEGWCLSLCVSPAAAHQHKLVSAASGRKAKSTCKGWVDQGALWVQSSRWSSPACLVMLKHCRRLLGLPYLPHKLLSGGVLGHSLPGLWLSSEFSVCREWPTERHPWKRQRAGMLMWAFLLKEIRPKITLSSQTPPQNCTLWSNAKFGKHQPQHRKVWLQGNTFP